MGTMVGQHGKTILPNRPSGVISSIIPWPMLCLRSKYVDDKNSLCTVGFFLHLSSWRLNFSNILSERYRNRKSWVLHAFESLKTSRSKRRAQSVGLVLNVSSSRMQVWELRWTYIEVVRLTGACAKFHTAPQTKNGSIKSIEIVDRVMVIHPDDYAIVHGCCERHALLKLEIKKRELIWRVTSGVPNEAFLRSKGMKPSTLRIRRWSVAGVNIWLVFYYVFWLKQVIGQFGAFLFRSHIIQQTVWFC